MTAAATLEPGPAVKSSEDEASPPPCFHCGTLCHGPLLRFEDKAFCCRGCQTVFEILRGSGLTDFYQLSETAGVRVNATARQEQFRYLDAPAVREKLVDFSDAHLTRVTFRIPSIHCIACVWLLENLFRLQPGIGPSQVNFARRELALSFNPAQLKLSELVTLLATLGYEPELRLSDLEAGAARRTGAPRHLYLQLGVAGFATGNLMLFSIASYFGLDAFAGPTFARMVGWISFLLAIPVVVYSARDYWRAARVSLQQRLLNIDVPIAVGVAAIFLQSTYEVFSGRSGGYFDSLCGLIFFLLCGRLFQQKTYDRLAFDRDYKSFFPLAVTRKVGRAGNPLAAVRGSQSDGAHGVTRPASAAEEQVSLAQLVVGDRLLIRNGELIPADARLLSGPALIDYSFVTGESEPVAKRADDHLYAGGRQMGGAIEIEITKAISQSYLTSLWNQDAFRKPKWDTLNRITNQYSQGFTKAIIAVAVGAAIFWAFVNPAIAVKAFTSVLIVACPCALALAAPFALGTAQRVLARREIYLKNPYVLEALARVDSVVFDKTGTLTAAGAGGVTWQGSPLTHTEECWLFSMTRHSTHPLPVRIGEAIQRQYFPEPVRSFLETTGAGMEGTVAGQEIWMGSTAWLESRGVKTTFAPGTGFDADAPTRDGSVVHVAINGTYRGRFVLTSSIRPDTTRLMTELAPHREVALLSGDNEKEREKFAEIFGPTASLRFNQTPPEKLGFIRARQEAGRTVMMVGDGLNDAGALQQADVGVAVVENVGAFAPASDVILAAHQVPQTAALLRYAGRSMRLVRAAFLISAFYNVVGVGIAASGKLSPVFCAILMPVSSITVVGFATVMATWLGRRTFGDRRADT
jgi:Cu+-exporting ATPase